MKSKYKPNDGWLSVKLPLVINAKLREIAGKTRLSLTAIVCNGIDKEWDEFKKIESIKNNGGTIL
jgi:hypothetical protein